MLCNKCRTENLDQARYCSSCGAKLGGDNQSVSTGPGLEPGSQANAELQEYYEAAIGYKNTDYYLAYFNRFDLQGSSISWNWPAFFISFYWLLYRKMWVWALLYFLAPIFIAIGGIILASFSELVSGMLSIASFVAIFILFPMYANALYYWHSRKKILKVKRFSEDTEKNLRRMTAEGGTSWVGLIIIPIAVFMIGILAAIAIPAYQDFNIRARVAEGMALGREYKMQVEAYAIQNQQWPQSNADISVMESFVNSGVATISVGEGGVVTITYTGTEQINGKSVTLSPSIDDENMIFWVCEGAGLDSRYLSEHCRD